mgnify:CR=1 FL=1
MLIYEINNSAMKKETQTMQQKTSDNALAIIKAGMNLIPIVGGAIASLISDYIPSSTQRNTEKAMRLLEEKLTVFGDRIDVENINKDDFSELFKSCYLIFVRTHQEDKLRAAANILANLLLRSGDRAKVSYNELDHLIRCVDALSIGAITALGAARCISTAESGAAQGFFQFSQLHVKLPQFEPEFLMSLVSELRGFNLIHVSEPAMKISDYGNYLLRLTLIGRMFVEQFIEGNCA